jgi:hypothetical protein
VNVRSLDCARTQKRNDMPMLPPRMCSKCYNTALVGSRYCELHKNTEAERDAERHRNNPPAYNRNSRAWRQTRAIVLSTYPFCAYVDSGVRCKMLSVEAHHVVKATEWIKRGGHYLDRSNIVGLCKRHHTMCTQAERMGTTVLGSFAPPSSTWSPCV